MSSSKNTNNGQTETKQTSIQANSIQGLTASEKIKKKNLQQKLLEKKGFLKSAKYTEFIDSDFRKTVCKFIRHAKK